MTIRRSSLLCFPKVCGQLGKLGLLTIPQHRHDGGDVFSPMGRQEIPVWLRPAWGSRIALAGSDTALAGVLDHAWWRGRETACDVTRGFQPGRENFVINDWDGGLLVTFVTGYVLKKWGLWGSHNWLDDPRCCS
ncbi:hypothetical protein EVAR_85407_1 [Eumeta japonica]|uniref:Uncharacterized protein n=1 Tax=Eumeta variegata TaxID=151549 RepID=A0A4C1WIC6_EUMVA|nr:hypothetical protein EVAR_85407_1 [Eumeta japonica]